MANKLTSWGFGLLKGFVASSAPTALEEELPNSSMHAYPGQRWEQGQKEQVKGQHVR